MLLMFAHQTVGILMLMIGVVALGFVVLFWKLDIMDRRKTLNNNNQHCQDKNVSDESKLHKESEQNTEYNKTE